MKDTKRKILDTARSLFNDFGFGNVTIRMIALKLKMSSGNLNYHFKTREEILEALYFEMVADFDDRIARLGGQEITLQSMKEDISQSLQRMIDFRFIWTDLYNLLRLNSSIKTHFESVHFKRVEGYEFLIDYLNEKGMIREFEFASERQFLIERMIGFSNTWLYNSFIYDVVIDEAYVHHQTNALFSMIYPYLTDSGKAEFKRTL